MTSNDFTSVNKQISISMENAVIELRVLGLKFRLSQIVHKGRINLVGCKNKIHFCYVVQCT